MKGIYPIAVSCHVLQVSSSGYFRWRHCGGRPHATVVMHWRWPIFVPFMQRSKVNMAGLACKKSCKPEVCALAKSGYVR